MSKGVKSGKLYEKFLMAFIEQFIPKDKNILDIGANIGVQSIYSNAPTMSKLYALGYRKVMKLTHCDYLFTY